MRQTCIGLCALLMACSNAEAEKAAADARNKAFMEAEAKARAAADEAERRALTDAARQRCESDDAMGCVDLGKLKLKASDVDGALGAFDDACDKKSQEGCKLAAQNSKVPADALARWQRGCLLDDADACVQAVGAMDALAKTGTPVDAQGQLSLLERACTLGVGRTCTALGVLTKDADLKRAIGAFERGCDAKEPTACVQLAELHKGGKVGKKKDEKRAAALLARACELGLTDACVK